MPKYYCDYCDAFLTHDSPSVRKTHNSGRKHKENVRHFYQAWMEEQAQKLIDATTKAFTTQRMMAPNMIPPIAPAGMMPRPFLMPPMGMLRPPIMPPNSSGFFMPPVPTTGFSIANPGMPPRNASYSNSTHANATNNYWIGRRKWRATTTSNTNQNAAA
uniref:U1 small nuclear ribonucleoprotein C n=1 Tax=Meloidogyne incognita TaxID=6306 RepID=A0A914LRI5_MELIC